MYMQLGNSALILATFGGKTDIVVELVKGGADIDLQDKVRTYDTSLSSENQVYFVITQEGNTALMLASRCGTEAIILLLKAGADVNLQNNVCWCCV